MLINAEIIQLSTEKFGNSIDENEDSLQVLKSPRKGNYFSCINCAMADGATSTLFSKLWADKLTMLAVNYAPSLSKLNKILSRAQKSWQDEIFNKELPWNVEEKVKNGSFSSLLWFRLSNYPLNKKHLRWKAIAIGDTNLIILREKSLIHAFPLKISAEFGNNPNLLSSKPEKNSFENIKCKEEVWQPGDEFILSTDALAQYLLHSIEIGDEEFFRIGNELFRTKDKSGYFLEWLSSRRMNSQIKNDDTSIIWIKTFS